ncbi:enoyl-CoA hydratase/isomerase family protein [Cupriavidus numazuensis]|uniref:2,3-dehydroadipyl-CoA hydratase n=1 Tax=Cupriavidus numazuensis TaxID=221992 RepID=A0ABN7QAY4_9BURK|nr:enoyl-CoA hydratase/isomerase family protein [Cupriavidus numazuensis]CAG2160614.1 2,3-dehydroadipyl-CoA hydratase [Cupriavidus numazuensis]
MSKSDPVIVERITLGIPGTALGLVTLNRPAQKNPIDWGMIGALQSAMNKFAADDAVRAVAIIGAGDAFSAGGDLKKYIELQRNAQDFRSFLDDLHALFNYIQFDLAKPVMALINGVTAAGGLELALACDVVYAAADARIGDGHLNFGQMGGGGVLTRLPRRVLQNFGREVLFTGAFLPPEPWMHAGLVNRILPDRCGLIAAAVSFAEAVAVKSPLAVANVKKTLNQIREVPFKEAIAHEIEVTHKYCLTSHDAPEGLSAFAEKRRPQFLGR